MTIDESTAQSTKVPERILNYLFEVRIDKKRLPIKDTKITSSPKTTPRIILIEVSVLHAQFLEDNNLVLFLSGLLQWFYLCISIYIKKHRNDVCTCKMEAYNGLRPPPQSTFESVKNRLKIYLKNQLDMMQSHLGLKKWVSFNRLPSTSANKM